MVLNGTQLIARRFRKIGASERLPTQATANAMKSKQKIYF